MKQEANGDSLELVETLADLDQQCQVHLDELHFLAPWLLITDPLATSLPGNGTSASPAGERQSDINSLQGRLNEPTSLRHLALLESELLQAIEASLADSSTPPEGLSRESLVLLQTCITTAIRRANERIQLIDERAEHCTELADAEYDFLYDKARRLLSYWLQRQRTSTGCQFL